MEYDFAKALLVGSTAVEQWEADGLQVEVRQMHGTASQKAATIAQIQEIIKTVRREQEKSCRP